MATDYGIEILLDGASVTADEKASIVRRIVQTLEHRSLSITYSTTYSAGSGSTNQISLTVT